jgi:hypothetical protein
MMAFFQWLEDTGIGVYMREDPWGFAIALSAHSIGMSMALGVVIVATLRALNILKQIPLQAHAYLYPTAWTGFIINLISGLALYISHATEYSYQIVFMLKLGLIIAGGFLFKAMIDSAREFGDDASKTKLMAALSLSSWILAIITGRLMAYF